MDKFGRSLPSASKHKTILLQTPNIISLTQDDGYNVKNHRLVNVKTPVEDNDAVNKKYLDTTLENKLTGMYQKFSEFRKSLDSISYSLNTKIDNVDANCITSNTLLNKEMQKSKNKILKDLKSTIDDLGVKQIKVDLEKNKKDIADVDELINTHFSDFEVMLKTLHRVDMDEINKQIEAIKQEVKAVANVVYSKNNNNINK